MLQTGNGKAGTPTGIDAPATDDQLITLLHHQATKAKLYAKLAKVYEAVRYIQKDKRNSFHGYNYASEAAIKAALHEAFLTNGLILLPPTITEVSDEVRKAEGKDGRDGKETCLTTMKVRFAIADIETGEEISGELYGRGVDPQDKGVYKALTGALKYFLTSTFLIATGDDPEEEGESEPAPQRKLSKRETAKAASSPVAETKAEVAETKIEPQKYWHTVGEMRRLFQQLREKIGEVMYLRELEKFNMQSVDDFLKIRPANIATQTAAKCYARMLEIAEKEAA